LWIDDKIIGVGNVVIDITELKDAVDTINHNLTAVVDTIARTVEFRDPYTAGHQRRVANIAAIIAQDMGLDPSTIEGIRTAASIHDIGKISIPAEILSKPGPLSAPEFELIKQHPEAGYNIVADVDFPWPVAEMIRQHHERLDGSGYPKGLRGEEILLGARIIAVADVVEAMSAHRPYRPGHGIEAALIQIDRDRGTLLDDRAVEACLRAFRTRRIILT
jgi:putative nucleotidyltransferase with HDIG domain